MNVGSVDHALEVEGQGIEEESSEVAPGETTTLKVNLPKSGTYEIYCPVDGHKDKGMEGMITVGSSAGAGGTTTGGSTSSTTSSGYP
jgi:uncharacterized cupredoxin-like copper-binding protein